MRAQALERKSWLEVVIIWGSKSARSRFEVIAVAISFKSTRSSRRRETFVRERRLYQALLMARQKLVRAESSSAFSPNPAVRPSRSEGGKSSRIKPFARLLLGFCMGNTSTRRGPCWVCMLFTVGDLGNQSVRGLSWL